MPWETILTKTRRMKIAILTLFHDRYGVHGVEDGKAGDPELQYGILGSTVFLD